MTRKRAGGALPRRRTRIKESRPGREQQLIQFLKNLGLIGGLLMVVIEKQEASM